MLVWTVYNATLLCLCMVCRALKAPCSAKHTSHQGWGQFEGSQFKCCFNDFSITWEVEAIYLLLNVAILPPFGINPSPCFTHPVLQSACTHAHTHGHMHAKTHTRARMDTHAHGHTNARTDPRTQPCLYRKSIQHICSLSFLSHPSFAHVTLVIHFSFPSTLLFLIRESPSVLCPYLPKQAATGCMPSPHSSSL